MKETEQDNEPRVYNADEVITFEDGMNGGLGLGWHCIDGETRSYIELNTGKDYGTAAWGEKAGLYIEKADGYSRDYPFILAIGGAYEDVLNDLAERQNVYPDVDNVVEGYNAGDDYSKRFNDPENAALIGFEDEEDTTQFIIDTFDKHLYDRAFNQMIAKDTYMDSQTLESFIIKNRVNPAWRNEEGKCAFDYDTDEAEKLVQYYKDNDMEIPVAAEEAEQEHGEMTAPAADAPKPHYTVERVPFGKWMARPENAAMRPIIGQCREDKITPFYIYIVPDVATGHNRDAIMLGIDSKLGAEPHHIFTMRNMPWGEGVLESEDEYTAFKDAENMAIRRALAGANRICRAFNSDEFEEMLQHKDYTFKTEPFKTNKDLINSYFKVTKAYMTRSADKNWNDFLAAGSSATTHFTQSEQKQLSIALKALGASDPEQLGKILMQTTVEPSYGDWADKSGAACPPWGALPWIWPGSMAGGRLPNHGEQRHPARGQRRPVMGRCTLWAAAVPPWERPPYTPGVPSSSIYSRERPPPHIPRWRRPIHPAAAYPHPRGVHLMWGGIPPSARWRTTSSICGWSASELAKKKRQQGNTKYMMHRLAFCYRSGARCCR